jgi:hypothetical protein
MGRLGLDRDAAHDRLADAGGLITRVVGELPSA